MLQQTDLESKAIPKHWHKLSTSSMTKFPSTTLTTTRANKANSTTRIEMKINNKETLSRCFRLPSAKKNNQTLSGSSKEVSTVIRLK